MNLYKAGCKEVFLSNLRNISNVIIFIISGERGREEEGRQVWERRSLLFGRLGWRRDRGSGEENGAQRNERGLENKGLRRRGVGAVLRSGPIRLPEAGSHHMRDIGRVVEFGVLGV